MYNTYVEFINPEFYVVRIIVLNRNYVGKVRYMTCFYKLRSTLIIVFN